MSKEESLAAAEENNNLIAAAKQNNPNSEKIYHSDGLYFFAVILKYKAFIATITAIAAIASVVVSLYFLPIWFASTVNFVPPQESGSDFSSSTGGLSSVMKNFGLSKIGGKSSQEYTMYVFLESRVVVDSVIKKYDLAKVYDIPDTMMSLVREEFTNNVEIDLIDEGNYLLTVWDTDKVRAANIANDYVDITNYFAEKLYREELNVNVDYLTNRIKSTDSIISVTSRELAKLSKDKNIFSPEEQAKAAGSAISELKTAEMEAAILYKMYQNNYGEDDPVTQNAKEIWQATKNMSQEAYSEPGLVGNFSLGDATSVSVDYFKKYTDIEALIQTKAILVTTLEKALLDSKKNVQNFFVIDKAIPADKKDKPKRSFIVAGATFGGFILSIFIVLLINGLKISIKQAKSLNKQK
jgi:uncharacterized protein involved in exopolysaccharide biosynthesis